MINLNLSNIRNVLGPRVNTGIFLAQKYSPEIMIGTGVISGIAGAIVLARAHKKSEYEFVDIFDRVAATREAVEEHNYLIETANEDVEFPEGTHIVTKSEEMKLLMPIYLDLGKRVVALYGPALVLGVLSIGLIVGSHGILRRRNQALLSAVILIERSFNAYRERVREELGEEGDNRFFYGLEKRKTTIITTDEKTGKKKKTKVEENVLGEDIRPILYQRVFDDTNKNWANSERSAHFWLGVQQATFQTELESRGHLMLNTVLKELGFDETPEGAVLGWYRGSAIPGAEDTYVDFGVNDPWNETRPDGSILLNFNCNGSIWRLIGLG